VAWQWFDTRRELNGVRDEIATRLQTAEGDSRDSQRMARDTQEAVRDLQAKLALLDARVAEQRGQQAALEQLYQELSRGRDEAVLAELEQTLSLASQQLQLAGNVQGALVALQSVEARLARIDRPQFIALRRVIGREIERLKLLPTLDLAGLTLRIDQMLQSIDTLPMAAEARQTVAAPPEDGASSAWTRLGSLVWGEIRQLVRIERQSGAEPPLLAPDQRHFLRENLKLRLLNARIALMQRNEASFRADLRIATQWVEKYFDTRQKSVVGALDTLRELQQAALTVSVPTLAESLAAVRSYKVDSDRPRR
jgi:uroporphyrin-3 C-methyltransferase